MNAELDLGMKLSLFVVTGGLVILWLTAPKKKPRHRKWRD